MLQRDRIVAIGIYRDEDKTNARCIAAEAFQRLLAQYPQSDKAADAMLKLGYSQLELKQADQGKATLKSVTTKYPGSKAAGLAQERLRRLQSQPAN